jgi:nucleotide-binding universal stress UspA family protein
MFKRIVVPLDRTECALAVLPTARALAARTGATLALLHVIAHPYPSTDLADQQRRDARLWLRQIARGAQPEQTPTIIAVRDGTPAEEILTYADEIEADAICMATNGRTGIGRFVVGSVAEQVVHGAPLPVLLTRPDVAVAEIPAHAPIVVPLDGSPRAEAALPYAVNLAKTLGAPLALVRVWNAAPPIIPGPYAFEINQAAYEEVEEAVAGLVATYLDGVAGRLRGDVAVETTGLRGDATEQLVTYLREERPGLVVMGAHGRGGVPRLIMGSVAVALLFITEYAAHSANNLAAH